MTANDRPALYQSNLRSLPLVGRGKVRDNYALGDDRLLIVTTDRLSAFDVIMSEPIPDKGRVLNQMALFWFERLADVVPNHLTGIAPDSLLAAGEQVRCAARAGAVAAGAQALVGRRCVRRGVAEEDVEV